MTEELDPKTFDIAELFVGKAYPKESVTVYMDEATAYEISKAEKRDADGEDVTEELKALYRKGEESKVIFNLTGVSRDSRKNVFDAIREEFPLEVDFLGREKPNLQADDAYANRIWALHTESIQAPNGAIRVAPSEADIKLFRGNAPDSAIRAIEAAISNLSEGVQSGFEALASDHDFLSRP